MNALTHHSEWRKRTLQERLLDRRLEFRDALEERLRPRRGRWARIKMTLPKILNDPEVVSIIEGTLDQERLIGGSLDRTMELVLNRILTLERHPVELQGGLPERNRRKH